MSKLGRYSADRKKIKQLTTTDTDVSAAGCGTLFLLDGQSYSGNAAHSVPHPSDAGKGWWCKFVVEATGATTSQLDLGGDDCVISVRRSGMAGPSGSTHADGTTTFLADDLLVVNLYGDIETSPVVDQDANTLTIKGETVAGSQVEFVCDGSKYYVLGHVVTGSSGMVTVAS